MNRCVEIANIAFESIVGTLLQLDQGELAPILSASGEWIGSVRAIVVAGFGLCFIVALLLKDDEACRSKRLEALHPSLSKAESEICALLMAGVSPGKIALSRSRSICTVRAQIARILDKLGCANLLQLVAHLGRLRSI